MIELEPACRGMAVLVAGVREEQWGAATPCAGWNVGELVAHVREVARGFAEMAREASGGSGAEASGGPTSRWPGEAGRELGELARAWRAPGAWQGRAGTAGVVLERAVWGRIVLTELVVHGWDLARATGQEVDLPEPTLRACFDHVRVFVPRAPVPELWGPAVEVPAEAPLLERIVAVTGRQP